MVLLLIRLVVLVLACVCTVALFLCTGHDARGLVEWFLGQHPVAQVLLYALSLMLSHPFAMDVQFALAESRTLVQAAVVPILGAAIGSAARFLFYSKLLSPLVRVDQMPAMQPLTEAVQAQPFQYSLLTHMSVLHRLVPFITCPGLPCMLPPDAAGPYVAACVLAELCHLAAALIYQLSPDEPAAFVCDALLPAVWVACTALLAHHLQLEYAAAWHTPAPENPEPRKYNLRSSVRSANALPEQSATSQPPGSRVLRFNQASPAPMALGAVPDKTTPILTQPAHSVSASQSLLDSNRTPMGPRQASRPRRSTASAAASEQRSQATHGGLRRSVVDHRLETSLTDAIYRTPGRAARIREEDEAQRRQR